MLQSKLFTAAGALRARIAVPVKQSRYQRRQLLQRKPLQLATRQLLLIMTNRSSSLRASSSDKQSSTVADPDGGSSAAGMEWVTIDSAATPVSSADAAAPRRRRKALDSNRHIDPLPTSSTISATAQKRRRRVDYAPGTRVGEKTTVLLARQLRDLMKNPIPGITVQPSEDCFYLWYATIQGPEGSPYAGGVFEVLLEFDDDFPGSQPLMSFLTPIWHPNVDFPDGDVCVALGGEAVLWRSQQGALIEADDCYYNVKSAGCCLIGLLMLMTTPNPDNPLNPHAANQWLENKAAFVEQAMPLTKTCAKGP